MEYIPKPADITIMIRVRIFIGNQTPLYTMKNAKIMGRIIKRQPKIRKMKHQKKRGLNVAWMLLSIYSGLLS
jgi:hypothetical protein